MEQKSNHIIKSFEMDASKENHFQNKKRTKTTFQLIQNLASRYWYLYVICLLISVGIAFWINRNTMQVFLVRTSLLVKETKSVTNNPKNLLYGEGDEFKASKSNIPEEIALLESYQFIRRAVDSVNMQVAYFGEGRFRNLELYKNSPFIVNFPDPYAISKLHGNRFKVVFRDNRHFRIEQMTDKGTENKGRNLETNQIVNLNGCPVDIITTGFFAGARDIGREFEFKVYEPEQLTWEFKGNLNIQSNGPDGSIISIYLATSVPDKGIDFLNEYTRQYLNYKYEEKIRAVSQSLAFIDNQLGLISDSLGNTESHLENFKSNNNFSDASKMTDRSMGELSELDRNRTSLYISQKYYTSILNAINDNKAPGEMVTPSSVGIPDEATGILIQNLTSLHLEKQSFASSGITKNPLANELDTKINNLRNTLKDNVTHILQNNRTQLGMANAKSGQHQSIISSLPKAERKFVDINRENNLNEQIYLFLSQKKLEAGILKAATTVENKVIENALLDSNVPLKPKKKNNYALAVLLGLALPSGIIWLKTLFNKRIVADDIQHQLSLPLIGTIYQNSGHDPVVINADLRTATAESIRILRSRLVSIGGHGPKAFLITSMDSGEGKSFCSLNIATSLALVKKKTVLVNLDLRASSSIYDDLENCLGAGAYLDDITDIPEIIVPTGNPYLDYIPAGDCPKHSSELFRDDKIAELIGYLKLKYDYVIIDSSPLGKIADPLIVARYTNYNLIIVRAGYSAKEQVHALEQMYTDGRIVNAGLVINGLRLNKKDKSNYYYRVSLPKQKSKKFAGA